MAFELGKIGVWRPAWTSTPELAAKAEELGYGTWWIGGSPPAELEIVEQLLAATSSLTVATSIVNMWSADATEVARSYHRIEERYPGRFLLGVGIGHPEATQEYQKPYDKIVEYLDQLDAGGVPVRARALAALGPKVLKLSAERTLGALPYLTTPEHTRQARELLGKDALLVAEHKVVLDTDEARARATGREMVKMYLRLRNYTTNLKRLGFTDEDVAGDGSDRLIDALALHGDAEHIAAGLKAHLDAGADHVAIQPLGDDPVPALEALAQLAR
ncbi:LLM class F420-dependent oxidoreductase [Amycolatopsis albispora]|uniref:LLM class F420-dependent oxidoreductase n=1 Tax=Amycolatopsis albispora TaxID=1804986 RepID=A0A344LEH1_9PSEU|nr:LLM class F420-dependent oxidoreductase [Amycolatopsis albispora]AXB46445.1 LLM class F420-dependent oxidoreductase [Amycolatopsis albispora]